MTPNTSQRMLSELTEYRQGEHRKEALRSPLAPALKLVRRHPTMAAKVQAGQVRALGTSSATRSRVLLDVPTIAEAGVSGFDAVIWLGIVAPVDTPKPIVDKLNAAINYTIARPEIVAAWKRQGAKPMTMTPAEFDAFLRKDIEKWAQVAKFSGMIGP